MTCARLTAEQIIGKIKMAEQLIAQGTTVADVSRVIEVTQSTYHRRSLFDDNLVEGSRRPG